MSLRAGAQPAAGRRRSRPRQAAASRRSRRPARRRSARPRGASSPPSLRRARRARASAGASHSRRGRGAGRASGRRARRRAPPRRRAGRRARPRPGRRARPPASATGSAAPYGCAGSAAASTSGSGSSPSRGRSSRSRSTAPPSANWAPPRPFDEVAAPAEAERLERLQLAVDGAVAAGDSLAADAVAGDDALPLEQQLGQRPRRGLGRSRGRGARSATSGPASP